MLKLALKNLIHRKGRTLITTAGIVIGIASMVILVGISNGLKEAAYNSVTAGGSLTIIDVLPNIQGNRLFQLVAPGKGGKLDENTIDELSKIKEISTISPEYTIKKAISIEGQIFGQTLRTDSIVLGIDEKFVHEELPENVQWQTENGVIPFLISSRLLDMYNFTFAQSNNLPTLKESDFLNKEVKILVGESTLLPGIKNGLTILRGKIIGFSPKVDLIGITVPLNSLDLFGEKEQQGINKIHVEVKQFEILEDVAEKIENLGYTTDYIQKRIQGLQTTFSFIFLGLSSISMIILIVSGLSILNTFLSSVRERKHDIGIMRSLGATQKHILLLFLQEASLIGFFGGLFGTIIGYSSSFLVDFAIHSLLPVRINFLEESLIKISPELMVFSIFFAILLSTVSALIPAYQASRLDPVKALKG